MQQYDMVLERGGADTPRISEQWEYKEVQLHHRILLSELTKQGKDGWQMCGCIRIEAFTEPYIYYFKRIKT